MLDYHEFGKEEVASVEVLYQSVGWTAYLGDTAKLVTAFEQSLCVLGVFDQQNLIGFIRCVGDGEHIVLVQDLVVAPNYQRQGIGKRLLTLVWDKYAHVRMFQLTTDLQDERAKAFYEALGMVKLAEGQMVSYFRP